MELKSVDTIYFLGIGGIGMSALARYFVAQGYGLFPDLLILTLRMKNYITEKLKG